MTNYEYEKDELLSTLLRYTAAIGFIALVPSVYFSLAHGLWPVAVVDLVAFGPILFVTYRKDIQFSVKLTTVVGSCLTIATGVLFMTGAAGAGYIWFIAAVVLSALFGRALSIIVAHALGVLLVAAYAVALALGLDGHGFTAVSSLIIGSNLLVVCLILSLLTHHILTRLTGSLRELASVNEKSVAELGETKRMRDELAKAVAVKEALLQELHHRVNNNMQLILSLIDLEQECGNGEGSTIRRRIRILSAANEIVLNDDNAAGADVVDVLRIVIDALGEEGQNYRPAGISGTSGNAGIELASSGISRFLSPQSVVLLALSVGDVLAAMVTENLSVRIHLSEDAGTTMIRFHVPGGTSAAVFDRLLTLVGTGTMAQACSPYLCFDHSPVIDSHGPGIMLTLDAKMV
jgi:hypothetical protein